MRNVRDAGKVCVLDIEVEGVKQIRDSDLNPLLTFVLPPSIDELKRRLIDRKTETPESLQKRLDTAHREIEYGMIYSNRIFSVSQLISYLKCLKILTFLCFQK